VYSRKPLPLPEQLVQLKRYLRRSRTELKHRHEEFFDATRRRSDYPFEIGLRSRAIDLAQDTVSLTEACIKELERQQAMTLAEFKPGDRVLVERTIDGEPRTYGPYLILDVLPAKRLGFRYDAAPLTKAGAMNKRWVSHWLGPSADAVIRRCDPPLNEEGRWQAEYYRRCSETATQLACVAGDLSLFERVDSVLGLVHYRRKDRLDPRTADADASGERR
jgi:hypothetical protein